MKFKQGDKIQGVDKPKTGRIIAVEGKYYKILWPKSDQFEMCDIEVIDCFYELLEG